MLSDTLKEMKKGDALCCWTGKVVSRKYPFIRSDFVRLYAFLCHGKTYSLLEMYPYRPAAFRDNLSQLGEAAHCLRFERVPTYRILQGRRGRLARRHDLQDGEQYIQCTSEVDIDLSQPMDPDTTAGKLYAKLKHVYDLRGYSGLEDDAPWFDEIVEPTVLIAVHEQDEPPVPRTGCAEDAPYMSRAGLTYYDAQRWYGKGVWCVHPGALGKWFIARNNTEILHSPACVVSLKEPEENVI